MTAVDGQLSIFDELAELEGPKAPAPTWTPPEIDGECEHCGAPVSSRSPMDSVNHGRIEDTCTSRWLTRNHARQAERRLDPDRRRDHERCSRHQGKRIPCSQVCWQTDYDTYAARATDAWGSDEWKEER